MFEIQWVYFGMQQASTKTTGLHLIQILVSLVLNQDVTEITMKRVKE
jgi:hypothetical protein